MSIETQYHNLTDDELIQYVDSHPCTELERELAERMDVMRLDIEQLHEDIAELEQQL